MTIPFLHDHTAAADEICPACEVIPTAFPTPEEMLSRYMTEVRKNGTVRDVAEQGEQYEIRAEIIECWENWTATPSLEDDLEHWDHLADIATHAVLALCRAESGVTA